MLNLVSSTTSKSAFCRQLKPKMHSEAGTSPGVGLADSDGFVDGLLDGFADGLLDGLRVADGLVDGLLDGLDVGLAFDDLLLDDLLLDDLLLDDDVLHVVGANALLLDLDPLLLLDLES